MAPSTPNQAILQVTYPPAAKSSFNLGYYLSTHMPLVTKNWGPQGLLHWDVVVGGPGAGFHVQATLRWTSMEALQSAMAVPELTRPILDDIKMFVDVEPTKWVAEVVKTHSLV